MTAQTLQQNQSKARNTNIARIAGISLALALLVAGALAYRAGSSASDAGRVAVSSQAIATGLHTPIRHASSSAYNGGAYGRVPPVVSQHVRDVPALHSTGSAYDGQ